MFATVWVKDYEIDLDGKPYTVKGESADYTWWSLRRTCHRMPSDALTTKPLW